MTANLWMALDIAILVYWIGVAILIISQDREPTATLAWLLVLFAIPFLGLIIYFLFGRDWPHIVQRSATTRRLQELLHRFMPLVYAPYAEQSRDFAAAVDAGARALDRSRRAEARRAAASGPHVRRVRRRARSTSTCCWPTSLRRSGSST